MQSNNELHDLQFMINRIKSCQFDTLYRMTHNYTFCTISTIVVIDCMDVCDILYNQPINGFIYKYK